MPRWWLAAAVVVMVVAGAGCAAKTDIPAGAQTATSPPKRQLSDLILTVDQLPTSAAGWTVAPWRDGDLVPPVTRVTCNSLFVDVTSLGVKAVAHAALHISASGDDVSRWHGTETIVRYAGDAAQAMQAIRDVAARCTANPSPAGPGANAVVAAGPALGDDSLELTVHLSVADDPNVYMDDDFVAIRSGQDLIVVQQDVMALGHLDPATTRLLATAAYDAYQRQH